MLSVFAPVHVEPEKKPAAQWPATADGLPQGRVEEGRLAYQTRFACASCHGDPGLPGSNTVGPSLDGFALTAGSRVPGQNALEYAYQSILAPNAFIAPVCAKGQPCARPSAMPVYSEVMSQQDMADLLQFLISQRVAERP
jgi:mono/diheme cytochrome c family protein